MENFKELAASCRKLGAWVFFGKNALLTVCAGTSEK